MNLYLATNNVHKVDEFNALIHCAKVLPATELEGMPTVAEDAGSFEGNARQKAVALKARAPASAWVLSDDSGLSVDALNGAPGVTSARYAGADATDEANIWKLLHELEGVPDPLRTAQFVCCLVLLNPWGEAVVFTGSCPGRIAETPQGKAGFGYDPVFIPEGYEQSFGELGAAIKSRLSHRARAVRKLCHWLEAHRD